MFIRLNCAFMFVYFIQKGKIIKIVLSCLYILFRMVKLLKFIKNDCMYLY